MENHLKLESSPYLLQHVNNPVDWYPWGGEALALAQRENRLLVVSIGYSTCHWCHVMAHEVFEDAGAASLQNRGFVSIKVDREERPDLDAFYMDACRKISGQGGWPLNVICLPDGRPVHALTYLSKEQWVQLLGQIRLLWVENPQRLLNQASLIEEALQGDLQLIVDGPREVLRRPIENVLREVWSRLSNHMDGQHGGARGAPKFPLLPFWGAWQDILQMIRPQFGADIPPWILQAETQLNKTWVGMAEGGLLDVIEGGIFRYSTDDHWHIPHFEKMLYDNAQWLGCLAKVSVGESYPMLRQALINSLEWLQTEMRLPSGLYATALDADSEGREGAYYSLRQAEVLEALQNNARAEELVEFYDISWNGNWEDSLNVPRVAFAWKKRSPAESHAQRMLLEEARQELAQWRRKRIKPFLDHKALLEYNALLAENLFAVSRALGDAQWESLALDLLENIWSAFQDEQGNFSHAVIGPIWQGKAFLTDLAYLSSALLEAYQSTLKIHWLEKAEHCVNYIQKYFEMQHGYFAMADQRLQTKNRNASLDDNVVPSGNAIMALVLERMGALLHRQDWSDLAYDLVRQARETVLQNPLFHGQWLWAFCRVHGSHPILTLHGPQALTWANTLRKFVPHVHLQRGESVEPGIEFCVQNHCLAQRVTIKEALRIIPKL